MAQHFRQVPGIGQARGLTQARGRCSAAFGCYITPGARLPGWCRLRAPGRFRESRDRQMNGDERAQEVRQLATVTPPSQMLCMPGWLLPTQLTVCLGPLGTV